MDLINLWTIAVGALMPILVGLVVRSSWSEGMRALVGTVVSIAAAIVTYGLTEGWDFDEGMAVAVAAVVALSAATLKTFWQPTGIYEWWKSITTPGEPTVPLDATWHS